MTTRIDVLTNRDHLIQNARSKLTYERLLGNYDDIGITHSQPTNYATLYDSKLKLQIKANITDTSIIRASINITQDLGMSRVGAKFVPRLHFENQKDYRIFKKVIIGNDRGSMAMIQ